MKNKKYFNETRNVLFYGSNCNWKVIYLKGNFSYFSECILRVRKHVDKINFIRCNIESFVLIYKIIPLDI